jgi:anti-sigma regulatory factor (Ser/Thr protein kinase)
MMGGLLSIEIKNDVAELVAVRRQVTEFGERHGLSPEVLFQMNLALEEILTNIIFYGYVDGQEHVITVTVSFTGQEVEAEVKDDGRPFNPLEAPEPDIYRPLEERPVGGLGIYLVRKFMDELQYRRQNDNNLLVLKKRVAHL